MSNGLTLEQLVGVARVVSYEMIDHRAATDEIMDCEDPVRLAQIQVGLERRVGQLDVALAKERETAALAAGRAEKRVSIALMDLARTRSKFLRDQTARLNHNFRQIAAQVLTANQYQTIEKEAKLSFKK